jgi:hypothetical protein
MGWHWRLVGLKGKLIMTRDECFAAISRAFDGAKVTAVVGFWNVRVATDPAREIVLSQRFVQANVFDSQMNSNELTEHLKNIPGSRWYAGDYGDLVLVLN